MLFLTTVYTVPIVGGFVAPMSLILGYSVFLMIRWVYKTLNPVS